MAIVQISRITNRKGLEVDLPQPLAGAELGWAIDTRQLYIGNGELADGAPVVGNTEILTEFSDILSLATAYTYQGAAAGYVVQTGTSISTPVSQSLQSRLDSYAVVTDFGAIGDGVTDCTAAINRALFQLYCRGVNPAVRRSLFFPAGVYLITGTINVPPYCMLYGEGADSSILNFQINEWSSLASYQTGVLVQVTAAGPSYTYYRSIADVPTGISISNPLYWTAESLPEYVMRTADSLQQTGANIGTNGATPPINISVSGMKLTTNKLIDGLLIQNAVTCEFVNMEFEGPQTTTDLQTAANNTAAIRWASTASLVCTHVNIDNCTFTGFTYGTNTAQQIKGCVISNSYFNILHQGVYLGGVTPVNGGPTGTKILHNVFDNIYLEGIVIDGVSLNVSGYNVFYGVGNHFLTSPAYSSIININLANNLSIGDMFERTTIESATYPRIQLNNTASIGLTNASELALGTYVRQTGLRTELVSSSSNATLFTSSATTARAFKMEYTAIKNAANVRTGVFTVVSSTDGTGSDLIYDDSGFQNSDTGLTLIATETSSNVTVKYSTTAGANVFLNYSVTKLA